MASTTAADLPAYLRTSAKYPVTLAPPGHGSNTFPALLPILSPYFETLSANSSTNAGRIRPRVMEFSSGEGYHISRLARLYRGIEFWASEADLWSCENLRSLTSAATGLEDGATSSLETVGGRGDGKVERIVQLDFLVAEQWDSLIAALAPSRSLSDTGAQVGEAGKDHGMELGEESKLSGIWGINFLHMIPFPAGPEAIFSHLSSVLRKDGFAIFYGPFKQDEDAFYSVGDEQFNKMIQSRPSGSTLGLRTISSLDSIARVYGWHVAEQISMPKGNWVIVFKAVQG